MGRTVSIPLRKVSRFPPTFPYDRDPYSFHPSKEGFKERADYLDTVASDGFHPSKEGFKEPFAASLAKRTVGFHPSKEGFKDNRPPLRGGPRIVSIPLRKVSRGAEVIITTTTPSFHPSKEGFKGFQYD